MIVIGPQMLEVQGEAWKSPELRDPGSVGGLTSKDATLTRSACLSMEFVGWTVIVPFSLAALLTGLVQSLGAGDAPFRRRFRRHWDPARRPRGGLLAATGLSIYRLWGLTPYGRRKQQEKSAGSRRGLDIACSSSSCISKGSGPHHH